jgi:hypothetical protein
MRRAVSRISLSFLLMPCEKYSKQYHAQPNAQRHMGYNAKGGRPHGRPARDETDFAYQDRPRAAEPLVA